MTYAEFSQQLTILCEMAVAPGYSLADVPDFANSIPAAISYSEGRCYRECVFLAQRVQNTQFTFAAGSRSLDFSIATLPILVVEGLAMITPAGSAAAAGTRQPFDASSIDVIDLLWPQESLTVDPSTLQSGRNWAMKDDHTLVVMPTPAGAYKAEITALVQPAPLSATPPNTSTYLSTVYPDMMLSAAMIFMSGFLRDYGAQSEDPKTGLSWEALFKNQATGVALEEQRRRTQGVGWSPNTPTPLATPPRT